MVTAGKKNDHGLWVLRFGLLQNSETVCFIHIEVSDHQVKIFFSQGFNSSLTA